MTIDKFGHYFHGSEVKTKYILIDFGFTVDENKINIENKRIVNVASPLEELDAVNKAYLNSQFNHMKELLKKYIIEEVADTRTKFNVLNEGVSDVYEIIPQSQYNGSKNSSSK